MIHVVTWIVQKWKQLWRTLWYPTANVHREWDAEDWVYKMNVIVEEKIYPAMGTYFKKRNLLESHLFDVDIDLYWKKISVILLHKTRNNKSFSSLDELVDALKTDEKTIKSMNRCVLTFWTFDHLHEWHKSYLHQARQYWDKLVTIVARDKTVNSIKWFFPDKDEQRRKEMLVWLHISSHTVDLWSLDNVYACLELYTPMVVFLWYDQHSFDAGIISYCSDHNLHIPQILRGSSFHADIYKSSFFRKTRLWQ